MSIVKLKQFYYDVTKRCFLCFFFKFVFFLRFIMLLASGISCLTLFWKVLSSYQLLFLPHSLPSPLLVCHLNEYSVISIYPLCSIYLSLYGSFWIILTFQFTLFSLIVSNLLWNLSVEAFISVMFLVVISSSISVWFCFIVSS